MCSAWRCRAREKVVHSSSTMLYGALDNDDMFMYMGGARHAIRNIDGKTPEMVVTNTRDPGHPEMTHDRQVHRHRVPVALRESDVDRGHEEGGLRGRRRDEASSSSTCGAGTRRRPSVIDDAMWQETFDVYVQDKHKLEMTGVLRRRSRHSRIRT